MSTPDELRRQLPALVGNLTRATQGLLAEIEASASMEDLRNSDAMIAARQASAFAEAWHGQAKKTMGAK